VGVDPGTVTGRLERYARACDRLAKMEAEWTRLGEPMVGVGYKNQELSIIC
jgi:hypothetical protein